MTNRYELDLWATSSASETLMANVEAVLGAVTHLPVRFWKPNMFFIGARDKDLTVVTSGLFPKTTVSNRSHPVYSLERLPDNVGFAVCPCTSKKAFGQGIFRYIRKGCQLRHTKHTMDRDSFLVEKVRFNIPRSIAYKVRFRGEVPSKCLELWNR